ncbi:MAG TPA: FAD-linked oxidase C-terminal domain-containing protein [Streptosporangiaceae bacterium]|nr:FAD-linked oxidase C-terminal domain-containing protein [Streptosporangiaceae bacterium]
MDAIDELARALPSEVLVTDPDIMRSYCRDRAALVGAGTPVAVARPTSTEQVSEIMRWATRHRVIVVPRGAGTGLSGGANAIDGCLVISLEAMTRIREIDRADQVAVAEAGVINADLGRAVREQGLFYPPDPGSFEISTIGGNIATNAGGMRCVKYGVTRDSVQQLEVVLADGRIMQTGARTIKNVAGLDLTSLFIGSEGTLGVITAATVRLRPAPATPPAVIVASFPTLPAAGDAVATIAATAAIPSMLELIDHETINLIEDYRRMDLDRDAAALLIGQADGEDALAEARRIAGLCEAAGADYVVCTQDPAEADALIAARRLAGSAMLDSGPTVIEDVGVSRSKLGAMLTRIQQISRDEKIRIATVGHAGDGNLHPTLLLPDTEPATIQHALAVAESICRAALAYGGTVTGEHGVGVLKRDWLAAQLGDTVLDVHRRIKDALDPLGLLNPGRAW